MERDKQLTILYDIDGEHKVIRDSDDSLTFHWEQEPGHTRLSVTAKRSVVLTKASMETDLTFTDDDLILANGYQSWTETREFACGEQLNDLSRTPQLTTRRFHFKEYGSQAFWPMHKGELQGYEYTYIKGSNPWFVGNLNYRNAYLRILMNRNKHSVKLESDIEGKLLEEGESWTVFDYMTAGDGRAYFDRFQARSNRKLFGYTSWYNHYQNISEALILEALDQVDPRFDLFQIDDGFETYVGDWLDIDSEKFPHGLAPVIERIHDRGMLAGIWLAPFVAEEKSRLMKEHPEWIARNEKGRKRYAGCNWSGDCALDLNQEEVVAYIRKVLRYYRDLKFDFFKLDFLYAVNLKPLNGKTRCETAEFAYELLRKELGDKLILGCGATLLNGYGRFDYCRIGPDVSLDFDNAFYMRIFHSERTSTKVTLLNTIFRHDLNGHLFLNDPDVFLLRDDNISLTKEQRYALTIINALYGSLLMTSDNIAAYDMQKQRILEQALELFRNGKVLNQERNRNQITIRYEANAKSYQVTYDMEKGILKS